MFRGLLKPTFGYNTARSFFQGFGFGEFLHAKYKLDAMTLKEPLSPHIGPSESNTACLNPSLQTDCTLNLLGSSGVNVIAWALHAFTQVRKCAGPQDAQRQGELVRVEQDAQGRTSGATLNWKQARSEFRWTMHEFIRQRRKLKLEVDEVAMTKVRATDSTSQLTFHVSPSHLKGSESDTAASRGDEHMFAVECLSTAREAC